MLILLFVALWFILRGYLLYVFPCVILFLCFSVLLVLRLPPLGKRELILVLFVRLLGLCLFRFVGFLFLLGSEKGCGLRLWHSLDFSLTFFAQFGADRFKSFVSCRCGSPGARTGRQRAVGLDRPGARPLMARPVVTSRMACQTLPS